MSSRPLPLFVDAHSVGNILEWHLISREEAIRLESRGLLVVVQAGRSGSVSRFDDRSPYWQASGPYDYGSLRYFTPTGFGASSPGSAVGRPSVPKQSPPEAGGPEEFEPLEEDEEPPAPAARAMAPAPANQAKTELRFDLALDPATPGLEDDVFVLSSDDGSYNQVRTVKDDKVPGDKKLSLVFPGVTERKTYTLSQVQDGEETVLVPSVTCTSAKSASPSAPGEVIGCKAAFRECRILGEALDITKPEEPRYPFELAFAKDKWVYVFGGPSGGAVTLLAEGRGTGDGGFCPVDVKKHGGKNLRPYHSKASAWLTLPLKVNGKEWDLFTCLSPIQLPWKRIVMLEKNPQRRCYRIGDSTGGACWVPGHIGREVPKLSKAQDSRIADPGKDILMIGLVDHMAEAKRRARVYQRELKPYLENRFDTSIDKQSVSNEQLARRRKKHVAGLLKVLLEQHPQKKMLADCLALKGIQLDQYLRDEDERELNLKKRFNAAAKALVKWMDSPEKYFEEVLIDYLADPQVTELWERVELEIAFLTAFFDVSSLTRVFGRKMIDKKESWVNAWLLNKDRFPAVRKPTQAVAEIINWLSGVVVRSESIQREQLLAIYTAWFPDFNLRIRRIEIGGGKRVGTWAEEKDWFPNQAKIRPGRERKIFWPTLTTKQAEILYEEIQISKVTKAFKLLESASDSNILQGLLIGLESNNVMMALRSRRETKDFQTRIGLYGAQVDLIGVLLETAAQSGARVGRGLLGALSLGSAVCDYLAAIDAAESAYYDKDYDQMAAQIGMAVGSATVAVGAAMVSATVYSTMAATGANLLTAGLGLSLTGAGSVAGSVIFLSGMAIMAGAAVASMLAVDDELEIWLTESPFGSLPTWTFTDRAAPKQIAILFELMHPVKMKIHREFGRPEGKFILSIQSPMNEYTKVTLDRLEMVDAKLRTTIILKDETLREAEGKEFKLHLESGTTSTIRLGMSDEVCWKAHRAAHPDFDGRFKYARLDLHIDFYDDQEVVIPSRAQKRPIVLPIEE